MKGRHPEEAQKTTMKTSLALLVLLMLSLAATSCNSRSTLSDSTLRRYVLEGDTNALAYHFRLNTNVNRSIWCGPRRGDFASLLHLAVEAGQLKCASLLPWDGS